MRDLDQDLYLNDPIFHAWASTVERALADGAIDIDRLYRATTVGATNYMFHSSMKAIKVADDDCPVITDPLAIKIDMVDGVVNMIDKKGDVRVTLALETWQAIISEYNISKKGAQP